MPKPLVVQITACYFHSSTDLEQYGHAKKKIGPDNSHVTNFSRLRLSIEKQEGKRKYESDGGVMVDEFVCVCAYVCACTGE